MKKQFLSLSLGALLAFGAAHALPAQDNTAPPPPEQQQGPGQQQGPNGAGPRRMDPDEQLRHLTRQLDLTADQQNQIRPVLMDRQEKMQALWQDQSISRQDRHSRMQAIRSDTRAKIEAVLNDQQKQKFEAMQERMHERGGMRGGDNPPPDGAPQPQ